MTGLVAWVSPEQLAALKDRPAGEGGDYLPTRLTRDGLFTQPLYAAPQPAPAIDLEQFREAVEALHAANIAQELARAPGYPSIQFQRTAQKCIDLMALIDGQGTPEPLIARPLAEWHEDFGPVTWWAWSGSEWAGEPAWCGTPNDSDWPGYHTHWTPHPAMPMQPSKGEGVEETNVAA